VTNDPSKIPGGGPREKSTELRLKADGCIDDLVLIRTYKESVRHQNSFQLISLVKPGWFFQD